MTKIGLGIQITQTEKQGANVPKIFNDGPWSKKIIDVRKLLNNLQNNGVMITSIHVLFSYTEEGMFITLVKGIKGRINDNVAGFIYIPRQAQVSGDELHTIVTTVRNELDKTSFNLVELESLFAKEYPEDSDAITYTQSAEHGIAYRIVPNKYSLRELLGKERYQKYYTHYEYILILTDNDTTSLSTNQLVQTGKAELTEKVGQTRKATEDHVTVTLASSHFQDITDRNLETYCSLVPPTPMEIRQNTAKDIQLSLKNGQPFLSPVTGLKDEPIHIIATRDGFNPILLTIRFERLRQLFPTQELNLLEWERKVMPQHFVVIDVDTQKEINGYRITINDQPLTPNGVLVKEADCRHLTIQVERNEYEPYKCIVNLNRQSPLSLAIRRKEKTYKYSVKLKSNEIGELVYTTRNDQYITAPLNHYVVNKRNVLVYDRKREENQRKKQTYKGLIIGLLAGIVLTSLIWTIVLLLMPSSANQPLPNQPVIIEPHGYDTESVNIQDNTQPKGDCSNNQGDNSESSGKQSEGSSDNTPIDNSSNHKTPKTGQATSSPNTGNGK